MFAFIVLLIVAGACFYFYQRLVALEQEIRAEQARAKVASVVPESPKKSAEKTPAPIIEKVDPLPVAVEEDGAEPTTPATLEETILAEIAKNKGMKQTELYGLFSDADKKQLQKIIKGLADDGQLKREKQGNSYRLYPV